MQLVFVILLIKGVIGAAGLGSTYYDDLVHKVPPQHHNHAVPGYTTKEWGPPIVIEAQPFPIPVQQGPPPRPPPMANPCQAKGVLFKKSKCKNYSPPPPPTVVKKETTHTNQRMYEDSSIDVHVNILNSAVPIQSQSQSQGANGGQAPNGAGGGQGMLPPPRMSQQQMGRPPSNTYRPLMPAGQIPHHYNLPWVPSHDHHHHPAAQWVPESPYTISSCRYASKSCQRLLRILRS